MVPREVRQQCFAITQPNNDTKGEDDQRANVVKCFRNLGICVKLQPMVDVVLFAPNAPNISCWT
jgi:hypothetical protein